MRSFDKLAPHPALAARWAEDRRLVWWVAQRLSDRLLALHDLRLDRRELLGFCFQAFNWCLWHYKPEKSRFSHYFFLSAGRHVYREFLQHESESWYRFVRRLDADAEDRRASQQNFAFHESEYFLYRIPEEDEGWVQERLHRFRSPLEAWEFFVKPLGLRYRLVVERRFRFGHTLEEIGIDLGVTKERVRQIEAAALHKMYLWLRQSGLCDEAAYKSPAGPPAGASPRAAG